MNREAAHRENGYDSYLVTRASNRCFDERPNITYSIAQ